MVKCFLEFNGFYESLHSDLIDSMLDNYFFNDEGESQNYDNLEIDYRLLRVEYSKEWVKSFQEFLNDSFDLDIELDFVGLESPKYYNFSTDKIEVSLNKEGFGCLVAAVDDNIIAYINEVSKSRSGFISFYNGFDEVKKENEIFLQYIFKYFIEFFEGEEFLKYYDSNRIEELIHNVDFIKDNKVA